MAGLTRTAVAALTVALGLAFGGVILVQHAGGGAGDAIGLACVVAGVLLAALTDTTSSTS